MRRRTLWISVLLAASCTASPAPPATTPVAGTPSASSTAAAPVADPVPVGRPVLTAAPEFLELPGLPEVWPADLDYGDYTPYEHFSLFGRSEPGLPGFAAWCAERGLIDEPARYAQRDTWFAAGCMGPYLAYRGVAANSIELFVRTSITIGELVTQGPITLAHGTVEGEHWVNDSWGTFIFTPEGMLDLRGAFPSEEWGTFVASIESTDGFAAIRALHESDPPLEADMWWDVGFGTPRSTATGYAVPLEWTMHESCHACETPYSVRARLTFDDAGIFRALRFEGFCSIEGPQADPDLTDWGPDPLGLPVCAFL